MSWRSQTDYNRVTVGNSKYFETSYEFMVQVNSYEVTRKLLGSHICVKWEWCEHLHTKPRMHEKKQVNLISKLRTQILSDRLWVSTGLVGGWLPNSCTAWSNQSFVKSPYTATQTRYTKTSLLTQLDWSQKLSYASDIILFYNKWNEELDNSFLYKMYAKISAVAEIHVTYSHSIHPLILSNSHSRLRHYSEQDGVVEWATLKAAPEALINIYLNYPCLCGKNTHYWTGDTPTWAWTVNFWKLQKVWRN